MNKILLAEYNLALAKGLGTIFRDSGYDVVAQGDYDQGARLLPDAQPDLLVVHVRSGNMDDPILSGLELIRRAKEWNPKLPVVVMTSGGDACIVKAMEAGATNYYRVGSDTDDLFATVERALRGETDRRPDIHPS